MIGIRADANERIATGHIMRCMSIAAQLKKQGQQVLFIISDSFPIDLLKRNGYEYVCLNVKWNEKEEEIDAILKVINNWNISTILLDSYQVTSKYMNALKKVTMVAYIDDLCAFEYSSDIIINYSLNAEQKWYDYASRNGTELLLGAQYIPLREEFLGRELIIKKEVHDVLITTGGSDRLNICKKIALRMLAEKTFQDVRIHIIVGAFFAETKELDQLSKSNSHIVLHKNVTRISDIMLKCDVAISAGGSTLNELCALGIPTICFAMADNQVPGIEAYKEKDLMISVGDVRKNEGYIDQIIFQMKRMYYDMGIRGELSKRQKYVIDGKGAERIAKRLSR